MSLIGLRVFLFAAGEAHAERYGRSRRGRAAGVKPDRGETSAHANTPDGPEEKGSEFGLLSTPREVRTEGKRRAEFGGFSSKQNCAA
jgi:hypothetical protein